MKIGRDTRKVTSISVSNAESIVIRGFDLTHDLIGKISFTDHVWLMVTGSLPSSAQRQALDACLVTIAEHGLSPSVQAARMTFAAAPEAFQGAVAAGVLGAGSVVLGSSAYAGAFFAEIVAAPESEQERKLRDKIKEYHQNRQPIPGYGHPLHKESDQRALKLISLGRDLGLAGSYTDVALRIESVLPEITGKPLRMNASGAIPALILDAGFPLLGIKGIPILARVAGLIAHLVEEQKNPLGFSLYDTAAQSIEYEGPTPSSFVGTHR